MTLKQNVLAFRADRRRYRTRSFTPLGWTAIGVVGVLGVLTLSAVLGLLTAAIGLWDTLRIVAGAVALVLATVSWRSWRRDEVASCVISICLALGLWAFALWGPMVLSEHDRPAPRGAISQERAQMFEDAGLAPERR